MKSKLLVLAYMGTGKTELEKHYDNVIDLDFQDYKYIYDESIQHLQLIVIFLKEMLEILELFWFFQQKMTLKNM